MTQRTSIQYTSVASGGTITDIVDAGVNARVGLFVPNSVSAEIFLQAASDQTSANFARVLNRDGQSDWSVSSPGGVRKAVTLEDVVRPFRFLRLELGAGATNPTTFGIAMKV